IEITMLIHDITCAAQDVRKQFVQDLAHILLWFDLENDDIQFNLDKDTPIAWLTNPKNCCEAELVHTVAMLRSIFQVSGGKKDTQSINRLSCKDYSPIQSLQLLGTSIGQTRPPSFRPLDWTVAQKILAHSAPFINETISEKSIIDRDVELRTALPMTRFLKLVI
ncbi:hypothetical protein JX265_014103, partial [Neoarthrinium moseri]